MNIFDELFVPENSGFSKEIGNVKKFGIIGEEEGKNKIIKKWIKAKKETTN